MKTDDKIALFFSLIAIVILTCLQLGALANIDATLEKILYQIEEMKK